MPLSLKYSKNTSTIQRYNLLLLITMHPCFLFSLAAHAQEDLDMIYADEIMTSLATGSSQPVSRAPAVASVITAKDIEALGATDLDEVLETVPGLHVSRSPRSYSPIYSIRGIHSENNPQVLALINGIPITNLFVGDRGQVWGGMPVKNISRLEIIRGPGSALHGADAFAGTINIVTKSANEINGTQIGTGAGSFDSQRAWLLHGQENNGLDIAFSFQYHKTDGQREIIDFDAQTGLDLETGTTASNAPGPVNTQAETFDAGLDLKRDNWQLRLGYQGRKNIGTGAGIAQALDPTGTGNSDRFNADLTYQNDHSVDKWDFTGQLSYLDTSAKSDLILFPAGATFPGGVAFSDGVIGNPAIFERHARLGGSAIYHGFTDHRIRIGAGVNFDEIDKVRESKNFDGTGTFPVAFPGGLTNTTNDPSQVFLQPGSRTIQYLFAQDEWHLARDWDLTGGVRWDNYSDFGTTVNPRAALVWQSTYNLTTKLLYGRAFRAPSFAELRNINNPVVLGNPNLDPEIIDTVELAFTYHPSPSVAATLNLFRYELRDIIRFVPDSGPGSEDVAQNTGDQTGFGLEWEIDWKISPTQSLLANYAYQNSTDEDTNSDVANAPQNQFYIRSDWEFIPDWNLNIQINWIADRSRAANDTRDDIDDYTTVDIGLRHRFKNIPLNISLIVRNLFNEDAREPSFIGVPVTAITNDLPLPGINGFVSVEYRI